MHPQRRTEIRMEDITLIVRPPGNPQAIKVFTDDTRAEAELYATERGAVVETLPLEQP
ncbi:MAG: hypothetical protein WBB07_17700 [Mycobacterium sp.]